VGVCDPGTGNCVQDPTPKDGDPCDDGLYCTEPDVCTVGLCWSSSARNCSSAGDQCNDGVCNETTDSCEPQPKTDGTACDDGNPGTEDDSCSDGVCSGNPVTPPSAIPTLSEWGIIIFITLILGISVVMLYRRRET
jgi:hypothetical protein